MAPPLRSQTNATKTSQLPSLLMTGITTRNKSAQLNAANRQPLLNKDIRGKRKAEVSPLKDKTVKRSALGNITNALSKTTSQLQLNDKKKTTIKKAFPSVTKPAEKVIVPKNVEKPEIVQAKGRPVQRIKQLKEEEKKAPAKSLSVRRSFDLEKSNDSSLYVSALEEVNEEPENAQEKIAVKKPEEINKETTEPKEPKRLNAPPVRSLPKGVQWDFDVENWQDPYQVSPYAQEIFEYLKGRESSFIIDDYMERQVCLSKWMRSLLVDWMVEVQESFELNHETLYLAVKLVDLYLTKVAVGKETLQLLGAASLFIASKYDERIPPMVEDFLYICDGAYSQRELIKMEINVLKMMDFDIGVPLSYRFLRRYARCAKITMPTLTLARYILEYSLMDYATIRFSDSKMACAALYLALYMKDSNTEWTPTLEFYTGYKLKEFSHIVLVLNEGLHRKPKESLATVRKKYSHKIFFEVAKIPLKEVKHL